MTKYTATLADGTILKRTTENGSYTAAYRVTAIYYHGGERVSTGFAGSFELARKAADGIKPPVSRRRWHGESSGAMAKRIAAEEKEQSRFLATRKIEVVAAIAD